MNGFAGRTWRLAGALLAVVVAVTACSSVGAAAQIKKVAEKVFPFEANGQIEIDSHNGKIAIESWDRNEVRVQITRVVRAGSDEQAQALLKDLRADVDLTPGRLQIVSRYPKRRESVGLWDFLGRKVGQTDIHYYLQVPRSTALQLQTTNGDIQVVGVTRSVDANTTNGNVKIAGGSGLIEVGTTNGELEMTGLSGNVTGRTTNGSVHAEVRSLDKDGAVALSTTNGNVVVTLPPGLKAKVSAGTTNGKVSTSFPLTVSGAVSSKTIQGTIGGGPGAALDFSTTNGDIRILKLGERDDE